MTVYKLIHRTSRAEWALGEYKSAYKDGLKIGNFGLFHTYETPETAVFMEPICGVAYLPEALLICCKTRCKPVFYQHKLIVSSLTPAEVVLTPEISTGQRVTIAILCALAVENDPKFCVWANEWLSGANRKTNEAFNATKTKTPAAKSAAWTAIWAAEALPLNAARQAAKTAVQAGAINLQSIITEVIS